MYSEILLADHLKAKGAISELPRSISASLELDKY